MNGRMFHQQKLKETLVNGKQRFYMEVDILKRINCGIYRVHVSVEIVKVVEVRRQRGCDIHKQ